MTSATSCLARTLLLTGAFAFVASDAFAKRPNDYVPLPYILRLTRSLITLSVFACAIVVVLYGVCLLLDRAGPRVGRARFGVVVAGLTLLGGSSCRRRHAQRRSLESHHVGRARPFSCRASGPNLPGKSTASLASRPPWSRFGSPSVQRARPFRNTTSGMGLEEWSADNVVSQPSSLTTGFTRRPSAAGDPERSTRDENDDERRPYGEAMIPPGGLWAK